jgi:dTDP-4-amino-4,6-dideoxygalactose transaminase
MSLPVLLGGDPLVDRAIPIVRPYLPSYQEIEGPLKRMLDSGLITNAANVAEFETKAAKYLDVKNVVAVSSCTSGLILTMKALGLKKEIILPSFTFHATAHAIEWVGAKPVLADCDPETFNIDPDNVESLINDDTCAIVAVNIFGNPIDYTRLESIAKKHNIDLIVDSAHGFGSRYKSRLTGGHGKAEVFSLSPTKVLVSGEGGLVATNDDALAGIIKVARNYGDPGTYDCEMAGFNARMAEFNAILGLATLTKLEDNLRRREHLVDIYKKDLSMLPGLSFQRIEDASRSTYKDFTILIDSCRFGLDRDVLYRAMESEKIATKKYFYPPLHRQKLYSRYYNSKVNKLTVTNNVSDNVLTLPLFYGLSDSDVKAICRAVSRIHDNAEAVKEKAKKSGGVVHV